VLDLRPVDETLRDRNGNAPKRALMPDELRDLALAYDVIVDVDHETQKRTIKDSGYWYRDLIARNEIAYDETLV
jgi:hypothetical protein